MVANAKAYNEDGSIVYADAERIRKMVSNFMSKNNPAYKDPNYIAVPTPIPGDDASATPRPSTRQVSEQPRKPTVTISLKNRKTSVAAPSPSATDDATRGNTPAPTSDFIAKTFQQAQEQIVNELILHTEHDVQIFQPFVNLPSRTLTDYYQVIKKPVSLTALKKRTKGQHGREKPTGISDFKNWDAFEEEVSYIWANARTYNEDGSDMFNLAGEFERYFKERLALAKQQVEGPQQPKITLKGRPKPVLHLGAKSSPAPPSTPGVTIDNDALARQKQSVQAGMNGHQNSLPQRPSLPPSRSASQLPATTPMKRTQSGQASSPLIAATAVKSEKSVVPSPSLPNARLQSAAPEARHPSQPAISMPPPAPRVPSGSPHPSQIPLHTTQTPIYVPAPTTFIDNFSRTKPVVDALLPNLTITTHPQLKLPKPFRLDIPPSESFTHQSLTVQMPAAYHYIQIVPTVSPHLMSGRQYKLFVTVNGARLMAASRPFLNSDINGGTATKQVYETGLLRGVNRIDVEIVASAGRGGTALETEKLSIFANLMRT